MGHFLVNCTTLNTLPSHIEIPFPVYILPTLIHIICIPYDVLFMKYGYLHN